MSLQEEIDKKSKSIHTSGYPMSIGELISLYRDNEIDLHPEFQRFFRWNDKQKTRLIESLLVGIPIPSIFVYQRDDGVWDIIDGVQRLSAIFHFTGILTDETGGRMQPPLLTLTKGDYLPSLEGKMWKNEDDEGEDKEPEQYFTMSQRIAFKRAMLDIKIIKEDKEQDARYQLFKRINMGGTSLSEQEIRNFLTVMINKDFYLFLKELASTDNFKICTHISDNLFEKQYDIELVMRFFAFRYATGDDIQKYDELSDFLTQKMIEFAKSDQFNSEKELEKEKDIFEKTFRCLMGSLKSDSFRRYDHSQKAFSGTFSEPAYDVIAIGLASNIELWVNDDSLISKEKLDTLILKIKSLWKNKRFQALERSEDTKERVIQLMALGKEWFRNQMKKGYKR